MNSVPICPIIWGVYVNVLEPGQVRVGDRLRFVLNGALVVLRALTLPRAENHWNV